MLNDTITPIIGTRNAIRSMWQRVLYSERGEAGAGEGGEGGQGGEGGAGGQGGEGGGADWRSSLPDNIKAHPVFQKYQSPNEALAAFVDVQKLIGPEKIIMPSKEADDKEWNERVFDRLGRPKKPEEYALPTDLQIPKELPVSEKLVQGFREQAHKLGMLPKQFQGMYKWFMNEQIAQYNDMLAGRKKGMEEATTNLRTEWGAAFDQNVSLGEKVLQSFADENIINDIKSSGVNNNPSFIKFLAKVGQAMSEDQLTGKPQTLTMSPEEAQAELSKMENNFEHPLYKEQHPEHDAAMKKRDMLYRMAFPKG